MILRLIFLNLLAAAGLMVVSGNWSPARAQESKRFDLTIENERLSGDLKVIRVQRGDAVEIKWSANRRTALHLHGYDIETVVEPGKPQTMSFAARATGRFPIETHGRRHNVLIYLEVHPR
jgi:FtsP/CotA-like multicopper oxidase with cupredoxin domain